MEDNLLIELNSKYNFSETIERVTREAKAGSWNMPAVHDLQKSLANSGKHVKPVSVIEICKPEYSGKLLELNHERIFSVFMPCRIAVYEKNDGKIYVSIMNGEALAKDQPVDIADVMKTASAEILNIVKKATQ
ncbi:MAG TPA: DUF302 domain-containing protein [Bacteroidales bacterium]|nr:DUF302 domain-containing protein [Bacteroidales bacterium]